MATLASWDSGPLPDTSGDNISAGSGTGFPADWINIDHDGNAATLASWSFSSVTTCAVRWYMKLPPAWLPNTIALGTMRINGSTINTRASLAGSGDPGRMRLYATAGQQLLQSPAETVAPEQMYRFEHHVDHSTQEARLAVFPLASDTPIWDSGWQDGGNVRASTTIIELGMTTGATPHVGHMEIAHVLIADDVTSWIGRHEDDVEQAPTVPGVGYWDGTTLIDAESAGYWDGTTLHPIDIQVEV